MNSKEQKRVELRDKVSKAKLAWVELHNVAVNMCTYKLWRSKPYFGCYAEDYAWLSKKTRSKRLKAALAEAGRTLEIYLKAHAEYETYVDSLDKAPALSLVHSVPLTGYERLRANVEKHMGVARARSADRTKQATRAAMRLCK